MSYKRLIVLAVALMLIVCLSAFSALADVRDVQIWGTIVGTSTNAWTYMEWQKIGQNSFAYKGTRDGSSVTNVNYYSYYFNVTQSSITNFDIQFTIYDDGLTGLNNYGANTIVIYQETSSGGLGSSTTITNQVTYTPVNNGDGSWTVSYKYIGSAIPGSILRLSFRCAAYSLAATSWHTFNIDNFVVNGIDYTDYEVTETNEAFEDSISQLAQNEERMWAQVVAPDLTDTIDRITQGNVQSYSDYKMVIQRVTWDNFLVPTLLFTVFSFAFYSYVIFGRKG